ncbi:MAG: GHKL domain-containing protein [Balneola sp.]|nr:GHKL domain-containing protein [Balneola sp.]MBO6651377.1 GHKL domain-containing protein [Balneola sp.]MBO6710997.1 GHKL domain-containing protein [Balneola sp.]
MPSNSVYSISQADNMVMWFITSRGVTTYDASEWYLFPESLRLPFTEHSYIQKDGLGRIWVAGYNKEGLTVQYYANNEWIEVKTPNSWPNNRASFSFKTVKNEVFLGFKNKVYQLYEDHSEWEITELSTAGKDALINNFVDIEGQLYITTREGVFTLERDKIVYSKLNEFDFQSRNVLTINKHNNSFYLLGLNWIGKITEENYELISDELGIFSESSFKKYSLEIDENERIYYSSFSVASFVDEETGDWKPLKVLARQQNLLSNQIFVDAENNYWVGDNRGLFKFNLMRFRNFNSNTNLIEDEVSSILEGVDGRIVLANPRALNFYNKGRITSIDLRNRYPDFVTRILDMEQTNDGRIFLALSSGGLISIKNGKIRPYDSKILNNVVTSLSLYKGDLLVANSNSVYKFTDQKLQLFGNFDGIRNIVTIGKDKLAILSIRGVYITDGTDIQKYVVNEQSLNSTYDIEIWNGEYLVATEAGLGKLEDGKIVRYDALELGRNPAYSIMRDSENNLWVGTNDGIFKTDGKELIQYNKGNGLIGNEINRNALLEDSKGDIWIGTDAGVSVLENSEEINTDFIPNIELKEFRTLDGTRLTEQSERSISYDENSVELKFRAISFFNEDAMSFQYKLDGFEEGWNLTSDISNSPIRYTNLNPGKYTLLVKGRVESGDWSEQKAVTFLIKKPFYQELWFILLSILLLITIGYSIYRLRVFYLIKQRETLRKLVSRRTEEIDMQNRNLKEAYKNLEEAHIKLVQTEKMAALGVLTAGIAHEINNPLNYIKSGKEIIKQITEQNNSEIIISDKDTFKTVLDGIDLGVDKIMNITKSLGAFTSTSDKVNNRVFLNKVIDDTLIILDHDLKNRINVSREYATKDIFIIGNEGKLYQVFSNLITNSIHAIEGDGEISISAKEAEDKTIVSITDSGCGIPDEMLNKIFDPFFTTKEQGKGTGLGLSIVYNIIKELNGDIEIDSIVDKGTTVKLEFKKEIPKI